MTATAPRRTPQPRGKDLGAARAMLPEGRDDREFRHVDLHPGENSCELSVTRVEPVHGEEWPPIFFERGRWCIGEVLPEFDDCAPQQYCGEEPPVCE